jgi:hypothetical protein
MNKVWTYIISAELTASQQEELLQKGQAFVQGWTAHENKLQADFSIIKNRIIVIRVNEDVHGASGCSIDKLLRFIKEMQMDFNIELLNRLLVAYKGFDKIEVVHASKINELLNTGVLTPTTIIYNTSVSNQEEFANWETPFQETWLKKYLVAH